MIDASWVKRREASLIGQEDAAIRRAHDEAPTPQLRAFVHLLMADRERSRSAQ